MTAIDLRYESVESLISTATHGTLTSHSADRDSYHGTNTWDEAEHLYRDGWMPAMATIVQAMDRMELPSIDLRRIRCTWDVAGGAVDVGRYLTGDPQCMRRIVMAPSKPIVRIAVSASYSSGNGTDKVLANGAPMVALCDLLQAAGFGVEIDTITFVRGSTGEHLSVTVQVKAAHETIDLSSFAFAIAHPSYLRRFILGAMEMDVHGNDRKVYGIGGGYGVPTYGAALSEFVAQGAYDIDLTAPLAERGGEVERVVKALRAWIARNDPDQD